MKNLLILILTFSLACSKPVSTNNEVTEQSVEQEYITVEAQRKVFEGGKSSYQDYAPFRTRTVSLLASYNTPHKLPELSKYGGLKNQKEKATGFFHVEKIGDRWWAIDPDGYRYYNIALNSIYKGRSENNIQAFDEKFGNDETWIVETIKMLRENGFNCAGSWGDVQAIRKANKVLDKPFLYTINWNFMSSYGRERGGTYQKPGHTGFPKETIFVFDPEFEKFCDRHAKQLIETKDDPNLFGHFSDNELPFKPKALDNYLSLSQNDPGRLAAEQFLKEKNIQKSDITDSERQEFLAIVGEKYFSIVNNAIKKYDPNHLFLGSRFYSSEKNSETFISAASKHIDVLSFNYYGAWTPSKERMQDWDNWAGKPFLITEFYAKGEDSGLPNQSGAGFIVKTQKDRGLFYQNFTLGLLEAENCIGWHYFKYQDNDPTQKDAEPSNIDANKGIVDLYYEPWEVMMEKMSELNNQVYPLINYFDNKESNEF